MIMGQLRRILQQIFADARSKYGNCMHMGAGVANGNVAIHTAYCAVVQAVQSHQAVV
jgi:hypothetical protein